MAGVSAGCRKGPEPAPAIGAAYAGPAQLKLRKDIPLDSAAAAVVKHGEKLEILRRRRKFFMVRTTSGVEGWTDGALLLNSEDMEALRGLNEQSRKLPSQGKASTFGELNVHSRPWRQAPSFLQVKEGEKVDVLVHQVVPRTEMPRKPLVPPPPKKAPVAKKAKATKEPKYPPPSMPKPPGVTANWLELSKSVLPEELAVAPPPAAPAPVPTDDWTLIRNAAGQAGWVLTRRLVMSIPDEVAQYAEGRRITSYFPLGSVQDGEQTHNHWLWTTTGSTAAGHDFDSFRVFIWSLRRHRYETAYIERNLQGFAPVLLEQVSFSGGSRQSPASYPGFSVCVQKANGQRYRRSYAFLTNIVRFAGERPCEVQATAAQVAGAAPPVVTAPGVPAPEPAAEPFFERLKKRLKAWTRGRFGG
jgi:hypothetical protein